MLRGHRSVVLPGVVASKAFAGADRRNLSILYAFLGTLLAVFPAACQSPGQGGASKAAETRSSALTSTAASAAQILAAVQAQPGSPVQPAIAQGFASASGALRPQFAASAIAAEPKPASLVLPQLCTAAVHLADVTSGAAVDISLNGALPVAAQTVGGYVVYPSAFGVGGTVFHRALPGGSEDFINLPTRPATPEVDYSVALGTGIAGLRLVSGMLEMLDSGGVPRLHVSPPYIVGADGARTDGALAVSGCAVDSDPSGPWGRPVTAPGAATCTVRVTWPDAAVVYPAILDPRWTTTGSMGTARFEHTLLLLSTGKALAAGGRSSTSGTTGLTSAELYDPTSGTWSPTGSMTHGRRLHSMTQLRKLVELDDERQGLGRRRDQRHDQHEQRGALLAERGNLDRRRESGHRPPFPHGDPAARRARARRRRLERHDDADDRGALQPGLGRGVLGRDHGSGSADRHQEPHRDADPDHEHAAQQPRAARGRQQRHLDGLGGVPVRPGSERVQHAGVDSEPPARATHGGHAHEYERQDPGGRRQERLDACWRARSCSTRASATGPGHRPGR